nr:Toll/interleukin-1 receptor (TIR) domain-containing protein [Tanacetum cinerariifolium]
MVIGSSSVTDFFQVIKSIVDRLANLDSPVKDSSLVTYAINKIQSKYPDDACVIRLWEKSPTFDELWSMMLLEESDMSHSSVSQSILHNTSSSPTILGASTIPTDKANTLSTTGLDAYQNFQHGSCTYGARSKFVRGANDLRHRPSTTTSTPYGRMPLTSSNRAPQNAFNYGDLYSVTQQPSSTTIVDLLSLSPTTWHRRLGYLSEDVLHRLESLIRSS